MSKQPLQSYKEVGRLLTMSEQPKRGTGRLLTMSKQPKRGRKSTYNE